MQLRDYQVELSDKATQILKDYGLVYLAMQVRTGKTLTAFATAHKFGAKKVLFVTKKKAIDDIIAQGLELGLKLEIYVTNYEQLHNVGAEFDLVIIDEAHSIGAFPTPSLRAKELKRICNDKPIIYLSGTPTPESFSQLFYQMWVSSFSPFKDHKNFYHWARVYVDIRKKYLYGKQINDYSYAKRDLIEEKTNHLFLAFTQEEAGFTELVKENVLYVKMEDNTYKFAERLRIDKVITNKEGRTVLGDTAVKLMNKLHQIYSGSVIIDEPDRDSKVFDYSKAEFIKQFFQGKKIAIFYKFQAERMAIKWIMGKCYDDPTEFNNNNDGCFISQIVSGREGVNLSSADALVFYNIDFSATSYWQSRARIQTKDRVKEAQIYWIFSEGGIEDKIYKAVMDKRDYTTEYFKKDYGISK
jgi:SNF2 family DNA or RNA helicase